MYVSCETYFQVIYFHIYLMLMLTVGVTQNLFLTSVIFEGY